MVTLLNTEQVAQMLQISPATLETWRCRGVEGPRYSRIGGRIRYRESDIADFIERRMRGPVESGRAILSTRDSATAGRSGR